MVRKLFICLLLLFCFNSTVFAYDFLGNPVPATSGIDDNFYGVETMKNILDAINVTYDDTSIVAFTYYANESLKKMQVKDSTIEVINVVFGINKDNNLFMIPSNGTFSDTLRYLWLPGEGESYKYLMYLDYEGDDPHVGINYPFTSRVEGWLYWFNNNGSWENTDWNVTVSTDYVYTENTITTNKFVAPISTFAIATRSNAYGSRYYFLNNTFEFTKVEEPPLESGDTGGNVDLSGIQTGINNINNNLNNIENKIPSSGDIKETISGEVGKVTETLTTVPDLSGEVITKQEIDDALSLDFMADPYDNFWYELTTGLSHALTDNVRQYDIPWINGYVYTFNLDTWGLKFPPAIEFVLRSMSVIAITWVIVKYWKIIVDKISSGSIDEVLAMNEEEGIIDLF